MKLITVILMVSLMCALTVADEVKIEKVNFVDATVLKNDSATLVINVGGGCIAGFHFNEGPTINPLSWHIANLEKRQSDYTVPERVGHFMCLDRWSTPSPGEIENGMPFHGEASKVWWKMLGTEADALGGTTLTMSAELPLAGLEVKRTVHLDGSKPIAFFREEITNTFHRSRAYNLVQHPTVAPPFLDETTLVDCNATISYPITAPWPDVESTAFVWPMARDKKNEAMDMRHMISKQNPNVVSCTFPKDVTQGWTTAVSPSHGVMIGYVWKTEEYPWLNMWRAIDENGPAARGLEFGTSGCHRTFDQILAKGKIFDTPIFEWIDAGQTITKDFVLFLMDVSDDCRGVMDVRFDDKTLTVVERDTREEKTIETNGSFVSLQ